MEAHNGKTRMGNSEVPLVVKFADAKRKDSGAAQARGRSPQGSVHSDWWLWCLAGRGTRAHFCLARHRGRPDSSGRQTTEGANVKLCVANIHLSMCSVAAALKQGR